MVQDKKPWLNEPDYKRWRDGKTQLQCLILRAGSTGALCGYVRLPRSLAKKMGANGLRLTPGQFGMRAPAYNLPVFRDISVHGGLTYSGGIRTKKRGRERGVWIGFDCAHFGDLTPTLDECLGGRQITREVRTYRDINYVTEQVRYLAQQIKELAK